MKLASSLSFAALIVGCIAEVPDAPPQLGEQTEALRRLPVDPDPDPEPEPEPDPDPDPPIGDPTPGEPIQVVFKHMWCFGPHTPYDPDQWVTAPEGEGLTGAFHHRFDHEAANRTKAPTPAGVASRQVTVSSFTGDPNDPYGAVPGDYAWARLPDGWYVELGVYWGGSITRTVPATVSDPARLEDAGYHLARENWFSCGSAHRKFRLDKAYCPDYPNVPVSDFCSFECPCEPGEGGCDGDIECGRQGETMACGLNNGPKWGLPEGWRACEYTCGNGQHDAGEACDDGGRQGGDGCSARCTAEPGYRCRSWNLCLPDYVLYPGKYGGFKRDYVTR